MNFENEMIFSRRRLKICIHKYEKIRKMFSPIKKGIKIRNDLHKKMCP